MIYSEFLRLKCHIKTKAGSLVLGMYMLAISCLLAKRIPQMIALYNSVGFDYKIESFLFLWFGYYRFISISAFRFLFFATRLFPFIFLPLLLSWFGGDTFLTDYENNCEFLLYVRKSRKAYFLGKLLAVFMESFLVVFLLLIFQLIFAVTGSLYLKQRGIFIPDFSFQDVYAIISSCVKIPLYYSSISVVSYAISLFITIPAATYMLPVVIVISSSVLVAELTNNIPMDLAFYKSGLMTPDIKIYWLSVLLFLVLAITFTWVKICMEKEYLRNH